MYAYLRDKRPEKGYAGICILLQKKAFLNRFSAQEG